MVNVDNNTHISLSDSNGLFTSECESAHLFSKHFLSVYNNPIERGTYEAPLTNFVNDLSEVTLSENVVALRVDERIKISRSRLYSPPNYSGSTQISCTNPYTSFSKKA